MQAVPDVGHAEEVDDEADGRQREADAERHDLEEAVQLAAGSRLGRRGARGGLAAAAVAGPHLKLQSLLAMKLIGITKTIAIS